VFYTRRVTVFVRISNNLYDKLYNLNLKTDCFKQKTLQEIVNYANE